MIEIGVEGVVELVGVNKLSSSDLFIVSSLSFCIFGSALSTVNGFATTSTNIYHSNIRIARI